LPFLDFQRARIGQLGSRFYLAVKRLDPSLEKLQRNTSRLVGDPVRGAFIA
jgi:hypothetical protein